MFTLDLFLNKRSVSGLQQKEVGKMPTRPCELRPFVHAWSIASRPIMRSPLWMVRSPSASELKLESATSIKWPFSETYFKYLALDLSHVKLRNFFVSSITYWVRHIIDGTNIILWNKTDISDVLASNPMTIHNLNNLKDLIFDHT